MQSWRLPHISLRFPPGLLEALNETALVFNFCLDDVATMRLKQKCGWYTYSKVTRNKQCT